MTTFLTPTYPRLVGDVGGTHARFALVQAAGDAPDQVQILATEKFPTLLDAIKHYLEGCPQRPRHACLGIATPLQGDWVEMTNHRWAFSAQQLAQDLGLKRLLLLNDFTALALGVPSLSEGQLRQVGGGVKRFGAKAVLGPGTGLGTSALLPLGDQYLAVPGEGGHVTLAAATAEEAAVIAWLWRQWPHVSAERLLSGPGLVLLHRALAHVRGVLPQDCSAPEVTARALQGQDEHCHDTVSMFCAMLGTVASNLALTLGAVGGVYIGGGIVPALGDYFHRSPFRARFESKGRYSSYLADIPSYVIHAPTVALIGANAALDAKFSVCGIDVRT
ncbi:MAG: glucokinase [Burkholderiales bacterium]